MNLSNKKSVAFLVVFLLGLSTFLYESIFNLFPSFIHAWTQSDRYAIALQFLDNGFDFFHPATYNLQTIHGITRVDFPINEFIVAILMKLFGTTAPVVFRVYTLCISIFGLTYLYLFSKKVTSSEIKSGLIVLFVFFSPVYFYYQVGFIPSIPSIACLFAAYYYYFSYKESQSKKQFFLAIVFLLLSALMRFPFIIFLVGVALQQGWMYLKEKKLRVNELLSFTVAFAFFLIYYFYNVHLGRTYGNMFLDYFMPAKSISELKEIVLEMINHWGLHYFTLSHYALLLIAFIVVVSQWIRSKSIQDKKYWFHLLIVGCGTGIYFLMMARQYYAHDYYFLDSFFVPVVLLLVFSIKSIQLDSMLKKAVWISVFCIQIILFFLFSQRTQNERYTSGPWDRTEITRQNFTGTEKFLDDFGMPKEAKILVIDAYTTNAPLILMNRKGYTVLGTTAENISTSLFWADWDYVAIQDLYLVSDVIKSYPFITTLIDRVGGNGKVSFYKKSKEAKEKSLKQFLGITKENTFFAPPIQDSTLVVLDSTTEFGVTTSVKASELKNEKNLKVLVRCDFVSHQELGEMQLVVTIANKYKTVYYQNFFLRDYYKPSIQWQKMEFQFVLPPFETPDDELKAYLWNPSKTDLLYNNWEVIVYK